MIASVLGLTYTYAGERDAAVRGFNLQVRRGERLLLTGPSGCGKSTVLRALAGLLGRHGTGELRGQVFVDGEDVAHRGPAERAGLVGFVSQVPGDQLVAGTVKDEVAFACESAGWDRVRTAARVEEVLRTVGLEGLADRNPRHLSGGQQQRLAVGAAIAAEPRLLVLDEALAHLDRDGARRLLATLDGLVAAGVGVVLSEHRLGMAVPWADRVVTFRDRSTGRPPILRSALELRALGDVLIQARRLRLRRDGRKVLRDVSLSVRAGERVAVIGANGSGKSTLIAALAGTLDAGPVEVRGSLIEIPQDPDLTLIASTVFDELALGPRERGQVANLAQLADDLGIFRLRHRPPHALSRGERLRVAVGAALAAKPDVLLLDEPTAGQDAVHIDAIRTAVENHLDGTLIFATHDLALARSWATRAICVEGGRIVADGHPLAVCEALRPGRDIARPEQPTAGARLDPRVGLALLSAVGVLVVALDRATSLGALTLLSALALAVQPIGAVWRRRAFGVAVAVVWSTVVSQALFYQGAPRVALASWGPIVLWREGVTHGLVQSLRLLAVTFAGAAVATSSSPDRLFAALVRWRVPYGLAFLGVTALRFVPVAGEEWFAVRHAWAGRGRAIHRRAPWRWLALEVSLLRPVVARSVRRARSLAESLDARGFDPVVAREPWNPLVATWSERVALLAVASLVAAVVVLKILTALYVADVWAISGWRGVYGFTRAWL